MSDQIAEAMEETGRWRARDVHYWRGSVERMTALMPTFALEDFLAGNGSAPNPYTKSVVRQPMTNIERSMPVGVVSNSYSLVQHQEVARRCLEGVMQAGVEAADLRCELGLTEHGEWMNLRLYFPKNFDHVPKDGHPLKLRLECFNSVDGSYRLVILLGWLRFVCSNGMVIGETKADFRELHNERLDLDPIPFMIGEAMKKIAQERERLQQWDKKEVAPDTLASWVDGPVTKEWGKKAACRVFHICNTGFDVQQLNPFEGGAATKKSVKWLTPVPGAVSPARTCYDVGQALTFVATGRTDAEQRLEWQSAVSSLLARL